MRLIILTLSLLPFLGITGADWTTLIRRSVPETLPLTPNQLAGTSAVEPPVSTSELTGTSVQSWSPPSTSPLSQDLVGSSKATQTAEDDEEIHQHVAERRDDASASSTSNSTESETSTTMPTPTSGNNKGSSMCKSLKGGATGPCMEAVKLFVNETYYGINGSQSRMTDLSFGSWKRYFFFPFDKEKRSVVHAGCTAIVQCGEDDRVGISGKEIQIA